MESPPDFNPSADAFTRNLVRHKVKQLIGRAGYTHQDCDDLVQEMYVRLMEAMCNFDADRSHRNAFLSAVADRTVIDILRHRTAEKRNHQSVTSLDEQTSTPGEDSCALSSTISERELDRRLMRRRRTEAELVHLKADMEEFIASLPELWQRLLELRKTLTTQEAAKVLGVPRTTLNDWMHDIRVQFERAGFSQFLP